jgi:hypothetical protein
MAMPPNPTVPGKRDTMGETCRPAYEKSLG